MNPQLREESVLSSQDDAEEPHVGEIEEKILTLAVLEVVKGGRGVPRTRHRTP